MKTLDEVIKAFEQCKDDKCYGCAYHEKVHANSCIAKRNSDALQYLKTYRENRQTYIENSRKAEEARERYLEAVKNCELAENKYRKLYEETSQNLRNTSQITCPKCHSEFVILPEANNALTWDELRQMEGKPVWVEEKGMLSIWIIIGDVSKNWLYSTDCNAYRHEDYGKSWQAYRKER